MHEAGRHSKYADYTYYGRLLSMHEAGRRRARHSAANASLAEAARAATEAATEAATDGKPNSARDRRTADSARDAAAGYQMHVRPGGWHSMLQAYTYYGYTYYVTTYYGTRCCRPYYGSTHDGYTYYDLLTMAGLRRAGETA